MRSIYIYIYIYIYDISSLRVKMWNGGMTLHILMALDDVSNKLQVPVTLQSGKHPPALSVQRIRWLP